MLRSSVRRAVYPVIPVRGLSTLVGCLVLAPLASPLAGCGQSEEPYKPVPAFSGSKPSLPPVPTLPNKPIKVGDGYTVFGASHHIRSRVHMPDVNNKDITINGYIIKTNLPDAPECAVHKTGKGDKEDCKSPIPAFWIADEKGGDIKDAIKVMGWASNFAQIFDAINKYKTPPVKGKEADYPVKDEFWGIEVPNPIPNVGAKVQVTGNFSVNFTKSTSGVESDPMHGILTLTKINYVEPAPELATLPGMPGTPGAKAPKKK